MRWTLPLVLLGVIAFCSFVGEGSASDWSAVYMTQELGTSAALGALAFAAFAVTMAIARFAADPLRTRLGNVTLVRGGSLIAAAGLGAALLIHEPAAGIAGFALLGLGLAPVVPIAFSAAGDLDAREPAGWWAESRRSATWARWPARSRSAGWRRRPACAPPWDWWCCSRLRLRSQRAAAAARKRASGVLRGC